MCIYALIIVHCVAVFMGWEVKLDDKCWFSVWIHVLCRMLIMTSFHKYFIVQSLCFPP